MSKHHSTTNHNICKHILGRIGIFLAYIIVHFPHTYNIYLLVIDMPTGKCGLVVPNPFPYQIEVVFLLLGI